MTARAGVPVAGPRTAPSPSPSPGPAPSPAPNPGPNPGPAPGPKPGPAGASFYALGPEFEWLASAWDSFARDLAETSGTLRHIACVASADRDFAAESSGLAALESATDRLVRELVDDAARIRRTLATYEQADAAVHASVPPVPQSQPLAVCPPVVLRTRPQGEPQGAPQQQTGPQHAAPERAADQDRALGHPTRDTDPAPDPESALDLDPSGPASDLPLLGALSRVRRAILARAGHWVDQQVPYGQESWHEGYRTDCSGFVSMCWGLRDSMVTSTMPHIAHHIAKDQLRAGDVLINTDATTGHVILFDRWADYAHTSYVGFELCPQGTLHHVVPYPYHAGTGEFDPYRYDNAGA